MQSSLQYMRQAVALLILFFCSGCAQLAGKSTSSVDEYSMAARSWLGAYIEEMTAVWPNPNMHCGSNTIGEAGCVWWRHRQSGHRNPSYDYRCEAIARYNEDGVITRIDVRESQRCDRLFRVHFGRMTRHTGREGSPTIEELKP